MRKISSAKYKIYEMLEYETVKIGALVFRFLGKWKWLNMFWFGSMKVLNHS